MLDSIKESNIILSIFGASQLKDDILKYWNTFFHINANLINKGTNVNEVIGLLEDLGYLVYCFYTIYIFNYLRGQLKNYNTADKTMIFSIVMFPSELDLENFDLDRDANRLLNELLVSLNYLDSVITLKNRIQNFSNLFITLIDRIGEVYINYIDY